MQNSLRNHECSRNEVFNVSKSERFLTNHHYSISQIERILEFRKFWNQNLDVRENLNLMITYSGMSDLYGP